MPTKTLIVPEEHLERMLAQWLDKQGGNPEYRVPQCWSCGKKMRGRMWHVFFRGGQREAHLCRDCGKKYEHTDGQLSLGDFTQMMESIYKTGAEPDIVWLHPIDYTWLMTHKLPNGDLDMDGFAQFKWMGRMKMLLREKRWPYSRGPKGKLP